ncbi:hypothetical protein CFS9_39050 [Flavobacterium sp. CFS9]|uniref:Anti-bacteriophage protein A/HamA C-terminal domain-containing protein n=1 Tax=Flavobacterium sp. CFS9 TaxID=3143118 RepID=A0AAT9H780_9FLAO
MHIFEKHDIIITEDVINNYADNYIELRSKIAYDYDVDNDPKFKNLGFSTEQLKKIIKKNTIPIRNSTLPMSDIYRSDLGEMILTTYFDKENEEFGESFIIPLKNIWDREHNDLPGRGIDVTGYKYNSDKIEILIGEAKVSEEMKNPPQASKEIFNEQKKYTENKEYFKRRISNYSKKLSPEHAKNFMLVIVALECEAEDVYDILYGCCLVRDSSCYDDADYGKMKINSNNFDPNKIHFVIPTFDKSIKDTIDLFYNKVAEKINE